MGARIIRNLDLVRRPWKNGGGTTAEILVEPPGADFEHFDWRISMADVATEGAFSTFPGIDRTLVLVEGKALDLDIDGSRRRLGATSPFVSFSGEAATWAFLPAGPIRDLNVMTRKGRAVHQLSLIGSPDVGQPAGQGTVLVVALEEAMVIEVGPQHFRLERLDVLVMDMPCAAIRPGGPAILIALAIAEGLSSIDDTP